MPEPRRYANATAFRTALETRLRQQSGDSQTSLGRLRRRVAFERLLARLFAEDPSPWLLKGGYALELRLGDTARATRDLDLGVPDPAQLAVSGERPGAALCEALADAAERDLGDWFAFAIGEATTDLDGPPGGGARVPVACRLDGRVFAQFHVDVAIGDAVAGEPDRVAGHDFLGFAGIPPARPAVLPAAQHFAEKIHAYTFPWRDRPNTRVRDLIDLVLLIDTGLLEPAATVTALRLTFARRATHPLPGELPPPPEGWATPFAALAEEVALAERTTETCPGWFAHPCENQGCRDRAGDAGPGRYLMGAATVSRARRPGRRPPGSATNTGHPCKEPLVFARLLCRVTRVGRAILFTLRRRLLAAVKPAAPTVLSGALGDLARSKPELIAENALLRQQLVVLTRSVKRPRCTSADRARLVLLASRVRAWRAALVIVQPATLLRWHRQLFRAFWQRKSRVASPARQPKVSAEAIALIREMATAKPLWGTERIRGEPPKLGIRVARTAVQRHMRRVRPPRRAGRPSPGDVPAQPRPGYPGPRLPPGRRPALPAAPRLLRGRARLAPGGACGRDAPPDRRPGGGAAARGDTAR